MELGDVPPPEFRRQLHELADWIADYREKIEEMPVAPTAKPGAIAAQLSKHAPEEGEPFHQIFDDFKRLIVPGTLLWGHPQFAAYFGSTTTAPGIEGEMLSGALNINAMTWRTSPAATELETVVLDWLRQWLGLPEQFSGVLFDTASVGIMHALAVAREEVVTCARKQGLAGRADVPRLRIYTSDQGHSSVDKAAIALGVGEENVRRVPSDSEFRMDLARLREMIAQDRQENFRPIAVVASVGTTSTASVDPIPEIAKVCRAEKMWLHIDGAYGAGLALLPECKWVSAGWSEVDSIVVNPHKMLFVPFDFSVLYVRDVERLRRVFSLVPEYLRGDTLEAEKNYMDYSIQLGRRFRAIKAWMVFRTFGRAGITARIREHLRLAHLLVDWIKADQRFEVAAPVVMPVVCFRLVGSARCADRTPQRGVPTTDKIDNLNSEIVERVNTSGRAYLTQTKLRGRTAMRIGLGNIPTTEQHLRNVWELIQRTAETL
ncbi:MAG: aspartate aminotransferase family protein [Chthoniobacterales bacterium]